MPGDLIIVIATFNERENLPSLVQDIHDRLPMARILVVDDNSPDETGQWVRDQAKTDARIQLLHRDHRRGLGVATIAGLQKALSMSPEWIVTMDADHSHRPDDLQKMIEATSDSQIDVVIGSRYVAGGKIENWPLRRRIASRFVNGFARWILWLPSRDNSGAFRIYRASRLQEIDLAKVDCHGYVYLEQILVHLRKAGARFHEVPIVFSERHQGHSKVNARELFRNIRDLVWLAFRRV